MGKPGPKKQERPEGREQYEKQKRNAAQRGIDWQFTFDAWWAWWQIDGRWQRRGRRGHEFVMARKGDIGPYSPENVYCATAHQNTRDVPPEKRSEASRKAALIRSFDHLNAGEGHPRSKAVLTPSGRFGNIRLAAEHHGYSASRCSRLLSRKAHGWRYASDERAAPALQE
jgi:hypothetical protein